MNYQSLRNIIFDSQIEHINLKLLPSSKNRKEKPSLVPESRSGEVLSGDPYISGSATTSRPWLSSSEDSPSSWRP